jgi:general secretion pathway protein G
MEQMKKSYNMAAVARQQGFTLIEVMAVIVILGVLAALVVPSVMGKVDTSKIKTTKISMQAIAGELDQFKMDNNRYPSTQEGLDALIHQPASAKNWPQGGYLKGGNIKDGWDNDFQYVSPGSNGRPFDLYSFGGDGKDGGEDNDADIYYADGK